MTRLLLFSKYLFLRIFLGVLLCVVSCGNNAKVYEAPISGQPQKVSAARGGITNTDSSGLDGDEVQSLLQEHNRVRSAVGVGLFSWSSDLAEYAQQWADHLAGSECQIEHRPTEGEWKGIYGENLFTGTAGYYDVGDGVEAWESEEPFFKGDAVTLANVQQIGHYTQLVWRRTTQVGCGKAKCQGRIILVCNYAPPGNVVDEVPY